MQDFSVDQWIQFALRRRVIMTEVAVAILVVVVIATFVWPPTYKSTAKILIQDNRAQLLVSPALENNSPNQPAVIANTVTEEELNSERELLSSDYLIQQALAGLPESKPGAGGMLAEVVEAVIELPNRIYGLIHGAAPETPRQQWAHRIERHFSSWVIKRSDVIEISFTAHDPKWSHDFLERLIDAYQEFHSSMSHDPQAERFFQKQADILQTRLRAAEDQLRAYQVQTGITSPSAQKQALITRIAQLQNDAAKTAADLAAAKRRVTVLTSEVGSTPKRVGKEVKVVQNMALQQLKPQVLQLEAERAELLTRYQPDSARMKEIDARLAAAHRILDRENNTEVQEQSTDLNPVWLQLDTELQQATAMSAALQATQAAQRDETAKAQEQVKQLLNASVEDDRLQRLVDTEKQAYLSYLRRGEEARAAGALNRSKILNVSVAEPPGLPVSPSYPIVPLNLGVGVLLALGCALGVAYLEELLDPRIYSPSAVVAVSSLKTIAQLRELNQE
jgi:succinoglycan biosynthesis transport protein ExoP